MFCSQVVYFYDTASWFWSSIHQWLEFVCEYITYFPRRRWDELLVAVKRADESIVAELKWRVQSADLMGTDLRGIKDGFYWYPIL